MTSSTIDLVPHRPPAVLCVDATLKDMDLAEGRLRAADGNALRRTDGRLDPFTGVEALAQLAAAYIAFTVSEPALKAGMLVGIDHVQLPGPLRDDGDYLLRARKTAALGDVTAFDGELLRDGVNLLRGRLKVWVGRSLPEPPRVPPCPPAAADLQEPAPPGDRLAAAMLGHLRGLSRSDGVAEGVFAFPGSFPGFAGHFPGAPVLPGVLVLKLGELMASLAAGVPLRPLGVERAKFARPVRPGEPLRVAAAAAAGLFKCVATVGGAPAAAFTMAMERL